MEKRAIIAFVLSMAILLGWEFFFGMHGTPPQHPHKTSEVATSTPHQAPKPQPSPPPPPVAPGTLPQAKAQITNLGQHYPNWWVHSSLYKMQILAPGARINSFQLKRYHEKVSRQSPLMQLVSTSASGYLPLAVDLLHHPQWHLATRPFTSQAPQHQQIGSSQALRHLTLSTEIPGNLRVTKTFTFIPGSYVTDVSIRLQNLGKQSLSDQMGISFYFEPFPGSRESSYNKPQLAYLRNGSLKSLGIEDLAKKEHDIKAPFQWIGYENNYFLEAVLPGEMSGYQVVPRVLDAHKGLLQMVYLTAPFHIPAGQAQSFKMKLYMGPKLPQALDAAGSDLQSAINYGWFTFLAKPLVMVLHWFYKYTHNYGVAIILLTVLIKILFWPLTQKSYKSMQGMKKLQPKITAVREKYKDDREKLNQELMMLYRTYKVNPLGGCLPMVLQIPVFFALYRMLYGAIQLRHQPFFLWINDLTAPDRLHVGIPIPYLGGIPVLTLLMGVSMFLQQKMTPMTGDPRQEKIMLLMPVVFTVFFVNFPSGLVLYWLVNNILSIVQQYGINRQAQ